jgi:hypothetical protein
MNHVIQVRTNVCIKCMLSRDVDSIVVINESFVFVFIKNTFVKQKPTDRFCVFSIWRQKKAILIAVIDCQ